ncbi:hypothetical protein [Serinicoccus sediminis]|uniref:hypothetical protein n=1 Tax=Serinicoccus sediminis TaxID=2306021 RepID=UPI001021CB88|nr:hypothetical protein [Serinicoccus sediminis]
MKVCPLGHENNDDAVTCRVCLRRLPSGPLRLSLAWSGASPVALPAGTTTVVTLGLTQAGGAAMPMATTVSGPAADWASTSSVTTAPGQTVQVAVELEVPAQAADGSSELFVTVRPLDQDQPSAETVLPVRVEAAEQPARREHPRETGRGLPLPAWMHRRVTGPRTDGPQAPGPSEQTQPVPRPPWSDRSAPEPPEQTQLMPRPRRPGQPPPEPPTGRPAPQQDRDRLGGGRRRGRRDVGVAAAVVTTLLVALALVLWQAIGRELSPRAALELSEEEALEHLTEVLEGDRAELERFRSTAGAVALQLSGKCPQLTRVDLTGPGGLGRPDGHEESYEDGVGYAGILAFHLGLEEAWGSAILATATSRDGPPCADELRWLTLHVPDDGPLGSLEEGVCECARSGVPGGECGARASDGSTAFWSGDDVRASCASLLGSPSGAPPPDGTAPRPSVRAESSAPRVAPAPLSRRGGDTSG